ncbi:coiled-coil domain-containing 80-like protein [Labeo rohita]|uniref:Coiled-coil domain-containing protein 80 n=1 Tax=Labeo rohita TaxID=84645 RepID=A0A498MVV3_LABRO|nr:coiled-coil domain-containing 80-like protein [Labeo rohita]
MQQIIMFHEKGKMGGKVRRVSNQGSLVEEPLDPGLVPRLMGFLKLEDGKFGMVLLRKTLQVEERYPYPVQLEAIYEAIDQAPMRRLEKARQKGFVQKCKTAGVEGQVVQSVGSNAVGLQPQVITAPDEQNHMYSEQRDEYLEQVCDMALRKISIISIFGPLTNSTMKIEHYQTDKPLRGLPNSDPINQDLITAFRKHYGMIYNDFNMVLTDVDMKVKQRYEVPIVMKAVFDYIDTLSTRIKEMEQQRKLAITCKKEDKSRSLEDFLSRFRWRRRLFVISTPSDEEWAYQQQLYAINSQACNLGVDLMIKRGLRHISLLKLVGKTLDDMSGVLELYPINGSASVDREDLSASLVQDIRNYFQISQEYFSMLLVGKDGNVKSWYPSPMWSMSIIYELVDSMQLRRQEMAIQQSLGMRCPDDDYSHHDETLYRIL